MKTECSVVRDLLPLYIENMVSDETAKYIKGHLENCPECMTELTELKESGSLSTLDPKSDADIDSSKPLKKLMKRLNRRFYGFAYSLVIFFVFLGFGFTNGENLMYNSLIMPIVGIFGYYVFRWKAVYKMPLLLLIIDMFICLFGLIDIDIYSAIMWTLIYSLFVLVGIAIAFLLHFAFRKDNNNE